MAIYPLLHRHLRGPLTPQTYPSYGLLAAHFDALGGAWVETTKSGKRDGALFTVQDNRFFMPAEQIGAGLTWLRWVGLEPVNFRFAAMFADLAVGQTLPDAKNYLAHRQSGVNAWNFGYGARLSVTADVGVVTAVAVAVPGLNYAVGNILPINGGHHDAQVTVESVDAEGGITGVSLRRAGSGYASGITTAMPAVNLAVGAWVTLPQAIADGTIVQALYCHRDGRRTLKGQAVGGFPQLHLSSDPGEAYGSANDGDNYVAGSLYYAWKITGQAQYKQLADKILEGLTQRSYFSGGLIPFDFSLEHEDGAHGLYQYNGGGSPWYWEVEEIPGEGGLRGLHVQTSIAPGGPPYGNAGWGMWPSWPVGEHAPFLSLGFEFWGDGAHNLVTLKTNTAVPSTPESQWLYGFLNLAGKHTYEVLPSDLWKVSNILFNADRTSTYIAASSSDGTATAALVPDGTEGPGGFVNAVTARFVKHASSDWANVVLGSTNAAFNSAGTDRLKFELASDVANTVQIKIVDGTASEYLYFLPVDAGAAQVYELPFSAFTPASGIVHPIHTVGFQPDADACELRINNIRCASAGSDIITLAGAEYDVLNGFEFAFSKGEYDVFWKNIQLNVEKQYAYPGLSRYSSGWNRIGGRWVNVGWQGPISFGYLWPLGWTLSDHRFPAGTVARYADGASFDYSGLPVSVMTRRFWYDAMLAYQTQFPAQTFGPGIVKFGAWGWESIGIAGTVAGESVPNEDYPLGIFNQFYFDGDGAWYGYQYRGFVCIAEDYFVTGDWLCRQMLNSIVDWFAAKATWNAGTKQVQLPTTFRADGSLGLGRQIYSRTCMAETLIYKYWVDGDPVAQLWALRLLEDIHTNSKIKSSEIGRFSSVYVSEGGSGYTYATATALGGSGATFEAVVACGRVSHIEVLTRGSGYVDPEIVITGDGSGAAAVPVLFDRLLGGYGDQSTGWEIAEIGKLLGMLRNGRAALGTVHHAFPVPAWIAQDYDDLWACYVRNTGKTRPSLLQEDLLPLHEFTWSSWHWDCNVENPVNGGSDEMSSRDTHMDGDLWTESLGPSMFYAVDRIQSHKDNTWLNAMTALVRDYADQSLSPLPAGSSPMQALYDGASLDCGAVGSGSSLDCGLISGPFPFFTINFGLTS